MDTDYDKTVKLNGLNERLVNLGVSVALGLVTFLLAYWFSRYNGLGWSLIYWFFSVGVIYMVANGLIGLFFGYALKADTLFWVAFILNIPIQIILAYI